MCIDVKDAVLAAQAGCDGIIVSNHGGRQLDLVRSAIEILPEVMAALRSAGLDQKMEVYIDGGIRRGTDIFKALALGAKGVGTARPLLYALAGYGVEGVEKCLEILRSEFYTCMRMMGVTRVSDICNQHVSADGLRYHTGVLPSDHAYLSAYVPLASKL